MSRAGEATRWLRRNAFAADVAMAVLLFLIAQAELWLTDEVNAPMAVAAPVAAIVTGAVAWRRRAPLAAVAAAAVAYAAQDVGAGYVDGAIAVNVAVFVLLYSVAAHEELRRAIAGGAMMLGAVWLSVARHSDSTVGDYFFSAIVIGGAWAAGVAIRGRRRERDESAYAAAADERARIARELHDVVAHSVGVMVVQAGAERLALGVEAQRTRDVLLTIETAGRQAIAEMRRLLDMLRDGGEDELALLPQPGLGRLEALLTQVGDAGLPVEMRIEGDPVTLPPGIDLSAYRIVQEALTNTLKHAGPARARVVISYGLDAIGLEVTDDGAGPVRAKTSGGHGLVGMRERVALYGGVLESGRRDTGGYVVRARLPLGP